MRVGPPVVCGADDLAYKGRIIGLVLPFFLALALYLNGEYSVAR